MRPHEIDYMDTQQYFLDTANGEVLAGEAARAAYIDTSVVPGTLIDIGSTLRLPATEVSEIAQPKLETTDWSPQKYQDYGRWLVAIVAPPKNNSEMPINVNILRNAASLGLGPSASTIERRYGRFANYYQKIGVEKFKAFNAFPDWTIADFVEYIKKHGGEKRPPAKLFDDLSSQDSRNPSYNYMKGRFKDIGGFHALLDMAGYVVPRRWNEEDHICWGVKFMQANDGMMPKERMIAYLASKKVGPGAQTVNRKFGQISHFQKQVTERFWQHEREQQQKVTDFKNDIKNEDIPLELLAVSTADIKAISTRAKAQVNLRTWYLGEKEVISRYAKYKVVDLLGVQMTEERKINIALNNINRKFVAEIRANNPHISAGDIEYAALTLGFFDDIWPPAGTEELKLDDGYQAFYNQRVYGSPVKQL